MKNSVPPLSSYFLPQRKQHSTALNSNKTLVLRIIKDAGIISRKELSQYTKLTQASITNITHELLADGLIIENGMVDGKHGRRMVGLSIIPDRFCSIGIRITPQYLATGLFDINSVCIDVKKTYWDSFQDVHATLHELCQQITHYISLAVSKNLEPLAIAMSLLGNFRLTEKECIMLGEPGRYIDLRQSLSHEFHLPVFYESSANYGIYYIACQRCHNYLDQETVINLNVSYDVDLALMQNRTLYQGAVNIPGSFGGTKFVDRNGTLLTVWDAISAGEILRRAKELASSSPNSPLYQKENLTFHELLDAFYTGDSVALDVFSYMADSIGRILSQLIVTLHPHRIYIGDETPHNETFTRMVIDAVHAYLPQTNNFVPNIETLGLARKTQYDFTLMGGCMYATNKMFQNVEWLDSLHS